MPTFVIETYVPGTRDEERLREIFFESSARQSFTSEEARRIFFRKYFGFYLEQWPELCFVARDQGGEILGYITGAPETDHPELFQLQGHLSVFLDLFNRFPGHLHMNSHVDARGQGVGAALMKHLERELRQRNVPGLHIMTGPESRNQAFYERMGFDFKEMRTVNHSKILFMAKRII